MRMQIKLDAHQIEIIDGEFEFGCASGECRELRDFALGAFAGSMSNL
jgi:hypothetical protein